MKKTIFSAAFLLSLILNVISVYRVFDLGVTTTYQSDEIKYLNEQLSDVSKIFSLLLPKLSRSELLDKSRKAGLTVIEKKEDHTIYAGRVEFLMEGDFVKSVKFDVGIWGHTPN